MNRTDLSSHRSATPSGFGSLRADPSSLFSRASVATVALVNAVVMAGTVHAQAQSEAPAKKSQTSGGEATVETIDEVELSEVVVTGQANAYKPEVLQSPNYTAPILDVPQTINVIPEAVIKEQGATTMREILRNVPGVSMQAGEGGFPTGDSLSIRGFSARTDFFVDGIRDIGGYNRDPFNMEQVEVAKGPSSSQNGRGTTGGSINLVSKTPKLDRFYSGELGIGTDQYKRFTLDLNQPINIGIPGTALRVNALWTDLEVPRRDGVEQNRWGIAPSLAFGLGTDTRLTLSYFHFEENSVPDYGIPYAPSPGTTPLYSDFQGYENHVPRNTRYSAWYGFNKRDYYSTDTDIITVEFEHDFSDAFSLRNIFRYGRSNVDFIVTAPRFATPTINDNVSRGPKFRDQTDTIIADKFDLMAKFDTFNIGHSVNFGIDFAHEESKWNNRTTSGTPPVTEFNSPNPEDDPIYKIVPNGYNAGKTTSAGLYFAETMKLHEKFEINGGVRWDHSNTDYMTHSGAGVTSYYDRYDSTISWRVGAVFKPLPNGSIYFGFGNAFNPSGETHTLSASTVDVDPEQTQTYELGTKWDLFQNRLSVNASIFRIEKTNARTPDPIDNTVTVLDGLQRVNGFEISLIGNVTDKWQILTGYTYLDSEVVESNNPAEVGYRLANTPQQTFTLWTTYQLPWNITVGGGAQYMGTRYSATNANARVAPEYWLFDAMASYKINDYTTFRVNVYNLTNEEYVDRSSGGHFIPGAGRSATFTLAFAF